jgi:hypothetical protein
LSVKFHPVLLEGIMPNNALVANLATGFFLSGAVAVAAQSPVCSVAKRLISKSIRAP